MQLIDRLPVPDDATVTNPAAQPVSGLNQRIYTRLKTSLRLNLRRQIFLAVCDNLELRDRLVARLQAEFHPRFIGLNLNLSDPNPMAQVTQWLAQHPARTISQNARLPFGFQILGVENLTRQPAPVQKRFLTNLQAVDYYLPGMECTMLLWLPRPWLRMVQQAAPAFLDWHTALFEFEGDPTPVRTASQSSSRVNIWLESAAAKRQKQVAQQQKQPQRLQRNGHHASPNAHHAHEEPAGVMDAELDNVAVLKDGVAQKESLWDILTYDLAHLDAEGTGDRGQGIGNSTKAADFGVSGSAEASAGSISGADFDVSLLSNEDSPESRTITEGAQSNGTQEHGDTETSQPPHSALPTDLILTAIAQEPSAEHHQEALHALQRIEQLQEQKAPPKVLAAAYYAIGRLYRDRLEQGNPTGRSLMLAIQFHEQTLAWLEENSTLWSDVLNDLGNLYWMQAHDAVDAQLQLASLEQAVQVYEQALARTNAQEHSQTYAMIQNNLGSAFGDLAQYREPAENLRKSVLAYETALRYRSPQEDPARYAATQNNLGTACWNLAQHQQPVACLTQAIAAYQEAVRYYTAEREPLHYAMIQNNLGTAFWNLAQHTKPGAGAAKLDSTSPETLLRQAIAAYQNALTYRTLETTPAAYAATQNNLGTAHWNLATLSTTSQENRRERLQQAITAYEAAITAAETLSTRPGHRPALTFDVFATHNNLGLAYYQLAIDQHSTINATKRQNYLELALKCHLQALQNWEPLSDFYQSTLDHMIHTVRAFYAECGIQGQNLALSQIPAHLLPEIMRRL